MTVVLEVRDQSLQINGNVTFFNLSPNDQYVAFASVEKGEKGGVSIYNLESKILESTIAVECQIFSLEWICNNGLLIGD